MGGKSVARYVQEVFAFLFEITNDKLQVPS